MNKSQVALKIKLAICAIGNETFSWKEVAERVKNYTPLECEKIHAQYYHCDRPSFSDCDTLQLFDSPLQHRGQRPKEKDSLLISRSQKRYRAIVPTNGIGVKECNQVVATNINLVKKVANRFINYGEPFEDLVQAGAIGLIKAVRRFDHSTTNKLSTYAVPYIEGAIKQYLRDLGHLIRVSQKTQALGVKVKKVVSQIKAEKGNFSWKEVAVNIKGHTPLECEDAVKTIRFAWCISNDEVRLNNISETRNIDLRIEEDGKKVYSWCDLKDLNRASQLRNLLYRTTWTRKLIDEHPAQQIPAVS